MKQFLCIESITSHLLMLLALSACGVRHEEVNTRQEVMHRDSLRWIQYDSLIMRNELLRQENLVVRWEEWVYSAPDSAGCQHVERVLKATAETSRREEAATRLHRSTTDSLTRTQASAAAKRQTVKRKTDRRPGGWWWLIVGTAGMIAGSIIGASIRKR